MFRTIVFAAVLALSAPAFAQETPLMDGGSLVAGPPADNSAAQAADTLAMRPAVSAERLAQARTDQAYDPFLAMRPVLGERFMAQRFPRTARLLEHIDEALDPVVGAAKGRYNRVRPYAVDARVLQCDPPGQSGGTSPSYPSGHAAAGWSWALILAELIPSHAEAILVRGREFGESRTICGFHYPSDIEASRIITSGVIARLHGDANFRRELDAARRELARARWD
jgi:acid phosphatase (class A)